MTTGLVPQTTTVKTPPGTILTTLANGQGPAGVKGEPGTGGASYLTYAALGPISGHRVMRPLGNGNVGYADSNLIAQANTVIGLSMNAAANGDTVKVQFSGEMNEPSWNWIPGLPVFCGAQGSLTQVPPSVGFQLVVAVAASPTAVIVGIKLPIIL